MDTRVSCPAVPCRGCVKRANPGVEMPAAHAICAFFDVSLVSADSGLAGVSDRALEHCCVL